MPNVQARVRTAVSIDEIYVADSEHEGVGITCSKEASQWRFCHIISSLPGGHIKFLRGRPHCRHLLKNGSEEILEGIPTTFYFLWKYEHLEWNVPKQQAYPEHEEYRRRKRFLSMYAQAYMSSCSFSLQWWFYTTNHAHTQMGIPMVLSLPVFKDIGGQGSHVSQPL